MLKRQQIRLFVSYLTAFLFILFRKVFADLLRSYCLGQVRFFQALARPEVLYYSVITNLPSLSSPFRRHIHDEEGGGSLQFESRVVTRLDFMRVGRRQHKIPHLGSSQPDSFLQDVEIITRIFIHVLALIVTTHADGIRTFFSQQRTFISG